MQNKKSVIGIDLGATHIRGAVLENERLSGIVSERINRNGSIDELLEHFYSFIDRLIKENISAIGIGVPGLAVNGMVYDLLNIPSWKEIPLKSLLEDRYGVPVHIANDANCFALGEFYFGKGIGQRSMIGLSIGTGLGAGLIIDKKIYAGENAAAGEIGMVKYLDKNYDYYASGQFFRNVYGLSGEIVYQQAIEGNADAIKMYEAFGSHLGNAIQTIIYTIDTSLIVLGGSVRKAFPFYSKAMWDTIRTFGFTRSLKKLRIEISDLENAAILGAGTLNSHPNQ